LAGLQQLRTGEKDFYLLPLAKGGRNSQSSAWTLVPSGQAEIFTEIPRPPRVFLPEANAFFLGQPGFEPHLPHLGLGLRAVGPVSTQVKRAIRFLVGSRPAKNQTFSARGLAAQY
jgi:hypothetical protein